MLKLVNLDTKGKIIVIILALGICIPTLWRGISGMITLPRGFLDFFYLVIGILSFFTMLAVLSRFFAYKKTDATYTDFE